MKKSVFLAIFVFVSIFVNAQTLYTYTKDDENAILNGIVTKYILQNDPAFKWYAPSKSSYNADSVLVKNMESSKDKVRYVVFGGTWCSDTQFILPKFFKSQELSGVPDQH